MIEKLLGVLPEHKDYLDSLEGKVLYVADRKDENNGGISFTDRGNCRVFQEQRNFGRK